MRDQHPRQKEPLAPKQERPSNPPRCCGWDMDYHSYHNCDFYLYFCTNCGRIKRYSVTYQCLGCKQSFRLSQGIMQTRHGPWICPQCANSGNYEQWLGPPHWYGG